MPTQTAVLLPAKLNFQTTYTEVGMFGEGEMNARGDIRDEMLAVVAGNVDRDAGREIVRRYNAYTLVVVAAEESGKLAAERAKRIVVLVEAAKAVLAIANHCDPETDPFHDGADGTDARMALEAAVEDASK